MVDVENDHDGEGVSRWVAMTELWSLISYKVWVPHSDGWMYCRERFGACVFPGVLMVLRKNMNAAKLPEQSKGLGGNIGCKSIRLKKPTKKRLVLS